MKLGSRVTRYGWKLDSSRKVIQDSKEQGVIVDIATRHARGESDAEIAKALRRKRIPGPGRNHGGDGRWWPQTIRGVVRANRTVVETAMDRIAYEPIAQQAASTKRDELLRVQREEIQRIANAEGVERFTFKAAFRTGLGQGIGISEIVEEQTAKTERDVYEFIDEVKLPTKVADHLRRGARILLRELKLLRQTNLALRQRLAEPKTPEATGQEVSKPGVPTTSPNPATKVGFSPSFRVLGLGLRKPLS